MVPLLLGQMVITFGIGKPFRKSKAINQLCWFCHGLNRHLNQIFGCTEVYLTVPLLGFDGHVTDVSMRQSKRQKDTF